ncbi:tyrosine-type recombinase/integrase [Rathayibacter tanaceti]|uniref:Site-specific recombinase XerD n=2 Tax=Rathayibacter tanaceti TaxID=1671680 RepID=A0ACD2XJD7_9MICO|nr:tyrosine-type recombinase/integrase [Rathayibacter tanaceti]KZX21142.1 putative prophage phiRv2 integrase [Rathayibacter tanaceti]QHC56196.1 tyrosine-type recombinase/integrase [Rathayibacter tanaceti]TCO37042.1 site-specific recombinase XerD [Rathayibacter tanaceti]
MQRKTGAAYEVRWRDGNGSFKQRTFSAKREAERFGMTAESELERGASTEPLVKNSKTVAEVVAASLAASKPELKPRTYRSAELLYSGRVLPLFGKRRIATLTRAEVQALVGELHAEGLAPMTVHHCYVALRKVCKHALHDRLISFNPCDGVKLPKNHNAGQFTPSFLTAAQVEALAAQLSKAAPYDLLVRFAAYTGLRAGELAGLRVQDVDLARGHVQVRQTMQHVAGEWMAGTPKSKRSTRDVPLMHSGLIRDLRRYLLQHPHSGNPAALFWPGRAVGGKHSLDYSRVMDNASFRRNYFRPALAAAKLPDMRVHDLRHTAASLWLAAGFQPYEVSRWLGHSNVTTTDTIYAHLYATDYTSHVAKFDAFVVKSAV